MIFATPFAIGFLLMSLSSPVRLLLSILLLCLELPCDGIAQTFQYEKITIEQGLSQGMIFDILQTRDGFLWIATKDGLNRYDGKQFKVYRNNPSDSNSLPSDDIWNIHEDKKGNFWVGTQNGLCYFEPNGSK